MTARSAAHQIKYYLLAVSGRVFTRAGPNADISPIRLLRGAITLAHMRPGMSMRRREFILGIAMLANVGASAQDRGRRIGVLTTGGPAIIPGPNNMFETILNEKGWIVGENLKIEYRITGGDTNLSRAYARELIAIQPDVLVAVTNTSM